MKLVFDRDAERNEMLSALARTEPNKRQELIAEYRRRSEAAFAPETFRNYQMVIRLFGEWCVKQGQSPEPPIEPRLLARWVDEMGGKLAANSIQTRLWAIAELHRSHFLPSPTRHRLVDLAVKGVKRKYGAASRQAPPLSKREVIEAIEKLGPSRQDRRDAAALWIATDSWCRASEIVAFKVKDLIRTDDGSSVLYVTRSKTDPFGKGAYAFLSARGTEAVLHWIDMAKLMFDDPILTKSQLHAKIAPMHPSSLSRIMKKRTGRSDVSAHSTRVGGVQDAFKIGCDISSIMVAGRWTSPEMPARYGRRIRASHSAAADVSRAHENGSN
ncbi:site-specific integrase [Sulfitobacter mediterraneus]|uniref:site-specific integrase n=1 Tax=Sulfitobacter mediterraneus TaxID=83219 RepID=UPI00193998FA|nr:site-specific integrase [Sulfitobacter mediterraneus]MBM1558388.1 site-specific integrase [Sulfitobacter mediterraneus]MBM1570330.1 site-specific integrase [Sulfitobacter mediterraneus]MBM1574143.1 site-specific integrase [Sulfitobacter mediterraneus]MBM1577943.1 site-specific integrase [Sulfitobacter mediterraneus]MBM1581376.1 site-specific integrase [Sulfitobacter mediterraneus]